MASMLDQSKLNDMWWAGFCSKVIEHAKCTKPGVPGSQDRILFMKNHLEKDQCIDCHNANIMKHLEALTAQMMGPQAKALFESGGNIAHQMHMISLKGEKAKKERTPFMDALKSVMDTAFSLGMIDEDFLKWMKNKAERYGQPYCSPI